MGARTSWKPITTRTFGEDSFREWMCSTLIIPDITVLAVLSGYRVSVSIWSFNSQGSQMTKTFQKRRKFRAFTSARLRMLAFLAVLGHGFITANVDNDPGGIL